MFHPHFFDSACRQHLTISQPLIKRASWLSRRVLAASGLGRVCGRACLCR